MAFSLDQFYRLNKRALIWIFLFVVIWLMRDFFGLIFLTFILAFIATPLARFGQRYLRMTRRISILTVFGCFLIALASFAIYVTPRAIKEAEVLIRTLPQIETKILDLNEKLNQEHPSIGPLLMGYIRSVLPDRELKSIHDTLNAYKEQLQQTAKNPEAPAAGPSVTKAPAAEITFPPEISADSAQLYRTKESQLLFKSFMNMMADKLREQLPWLIKLLSRASGTMLLALLFSLLITLDITRLSEEIKSLRASRLREFYEQAAQPVVRFAYVVGRSFQAQSVIAVANAMLTLVGMVVLGIPSVAMLSLIVFVCSFIPVLGVFISTTPMVLVALNSGGLGKAVAAVALVGLIHAVEAYLLNPLIYGKHLRLNPVIVLLILFVGHHAFGLWGMLLGVPVAYYFIHDVFGVPIWGDRKLASPAKPLSEMPRAALLPEEERKNADPATRADVE